MNLSDFTPHLMTTDHAVIKPDRMRVLGAPDSARVPGSFAIGDVRHGSIKRVATAVGEGAMAVAFIHQYLRQA